MRACSGQRRRLVAIMLGAAALCGAMALVETSADAQRDRPPRNDLWRIYPIAPEATPPSREAPARTAKDRGDELSSPLLLATVLTGLPLALAVVLALRRSRSGQPAGPGLVSGSTTGAAGGRRLPGVLAAVAALAAIEVAIAEGHALAAQIAAAILVVVLVNAGRVRERRKEADAFDPAVAAMRALALVALIRLIGLGLPLHELSDVAAVGITAVAIGFAAFRLAPAVGLSRRSLLAAPPALVQWTTALGGAALGLGAYLIGAPVLATDRDTSALVLLALAAATSAAVVAEIVFRGHVQVSLQRLSGRAGPLVATGLFACAYVSLGSAMLVLVVALAGLLFAYSVARSGVVGGAIAGHALFAAGAAVFWPVVLGPEPFYSPPESATRLALACALLIGAVVVCRRPATPVALPSALGDVDIAHVESAPQPQAPM